jgi:hypothetical protein
MIPICFKQPAAKLLQTSPSGFNSTGEFERDSFYDAVKTKQEVLFGEPIKRLINILAISEGIDPENMVFEFEPLKELTAKEIAEINKIKADTDGSLYQSGAITNADIAKRISADKNSDYGGIEIPEVKAFEEEKEEDEKDKDEDVANEGKVEDADPNWSESKHPRDRDGKFKRKGLSAETIKSYFPENTITTREINKDNFHKSTIANFKTVESVPKRKPDFISNSGSKYWYEENGVFRESDHWGAGIKSCDWFLNGEFSHSHEWSFVSIDGTSVRVDKPFVTGFAKYNDFVDNDKLTRENETNIFESLIKDGLLINKYEYNQDDVSAIPVKTMAVEEIEKIVGVHSENELQTKEMRKKAISAYNNLKSQIIDRKELKAIRFTDRGLKTILHKDYDEIKSIPFLPAIIEKGRYLGVGKRRDNDKSDIIKRHYIEASYKIGEQKYWAQVIVAESNSGNMFFTADDITIKKEIAELAIRQ